MATLTVSMQSAAATASSHVLPSSTCSSSSSCYTPKETRFAFARVRDKTCLIQTEKSHPSAPLFLAPIDVTVFTHEFGTMFRVSHRAIVSAADIQVLATIDNAHVLVEDSGVVFVARELTDQLLRWTSSRRISSPTPSRVRRR